MVGQRLHSFCAYAAIFLVWASSVFAEPVEDAAPADLSAYYNDELEALANNYKAAIQTKNGSLMDQYWTDLSVVNVAVAPNPPHFNQTRVMTHIGPNLPSDLRQWVESLPTQPQDDEGWIIMTQKYPVFSMKGRVLENDGLYCFLTLMSLQVIDGKLKVLSEMVTAEPMSAETEEGASGLYSEEMKDLFTQYQTAVQTRNASLMTDFYTADSVSAMVAAPSHPIPQANSILKGPAINEEFGRILSTLPEQPEGDEGWGMLVAKYPYLVFQGRVVAPAGQCDAIVILKVTRAPEGDLKILLKFITATPFNLSTA